MGIDNSIESAIIALSKKLEYVVVVKRSMVSDWN